MDEYRRGCIYENWWVGESVNRDKLGAVNRSSHSLCHCSWNGVLKEPRWCKCIWLLGIVEYSSLKGWRELWCSLDGMSNNPQLHSPSKTSLLSILWLLFVMWGKWKGRHVSEQHRILSSDNCRKPAPSQQPTCKINMSCRRSSPCLKMIPMVSLDRTVGSAHWNSSHRGFFLEAITLHFSICKGAVTISHTMNTHRGGTDSFVEHFCTQAQSPGWEMIFNIWIKIQKLFSPK